MKLTEVKVECSRENGLLVPKALFWKDEIRYEIDKVLFFSYSDDGEYEGCRYSVSINGTDRYLYLIEDHWYIEEA